MITDAVVSVVLLLNVGPMPDGRIEPRQAERLREMGQWLEQYGESIYGTQGGPFMPSKWGASTCKGDRVYLFVIEWPAEGPLKLPPFSQTITVGKKMSGEKVSVQQNESEITVALPPSKRDPIATVVVLSVNGQAADMPPVKVP